METVPGECTGAGGQNLRGKRKGLAPPTSPVWVPEAPPLPCPGAMPSSPQGASVPPPHQAICLPFPSLFLPIRLSQGVTSPDPWMELAWGRFAPTVPAPASFPGLCRSTGCFPLSGDSLARCWRAWAKVRLLLFRPPHTPKTYKGLLSHSTALGSRDHPLCLRALRRP